MFESFSQFAQEYGAWGLFFITFVESLFSPVIPDPFLLAMAVLHPENAWLYAFACLSGTILGGCITYYVGLFGGRPVLNKFGQPEHIRKLDEIMDRYGLWAVWFAGISPIPHKITAIASGVFRLNLLHYNLATVVSRGPRFFGQAALVYYFGEPVARAFRENMHMVEKGVVVLIGVAILAVGVWYWRKRKQPLATEAMSETVVE